VRAFYKRRITKSRRNDDHKTSEEEPLPLGESASSDGAQS
jgi:hypothetical protein